MASSPRPVRRFSRWRTTKRTFVLGDVTYKSDTEKQNQGNPGIVHRYTKTNSKETRKKNTLDDSKESFEGSDVNSKPVQVGQLKLNSGDPMVTENQLVAIGCEEEQRDSSSMHNEIPTANEDMVQQDKEITAETRAETVALPGLITCTNLTADKSTDDASNKLALSSISQNTSTNKSSVQTRSSSMKTNAALHNTTGSDLLPNESSRRKRSASDDGEASDSSSTDKENKEKARTNADAAPPPKRTKMDDTRRNVSSSSANKSSSETLSELQRSKENDKSLVGNASGSTEDSKRGSLRNRKHLTSAETLLRSRQYPVTTNDCSINSESASVKSKCKDKVNSEDGSSLLAKSKKSKQLNGVSVTEKETTKKITKGSVKGREKILNNEGELQEVREETVKQGRGSVIKTSAKQLKTSKQIHRKIPQSKKPNMSAQHNKTHDVSYGSATPSQLLKSHSSTVPSPDPKNQSNDTQEPGSSGRRATLRDRKLLPTPESLQTQRQYPLSYFYSSRKSSDISYTDNLGSYQRKQKRQAAHSSSKEGSPTTVSEMKMKPNSSLGPDTDSYIQRTKRDDHSKSRISSSSRKKQSQQGSSKSKVVHKVKAVSKIPQRIPRAGKATEDRIGRKSVRRLNDAMDAGNGLERSDKYHLSVTQSTVSKTVPQRSLSQQTKLNGTGKKKSDSVLDDGDEFVPTVFDSEPEIDSEIESEKQLTSKKRTTLEKLKTNTQKNKKAANSGPNGIQSELTTKQFSLPKKPERKKVAAEYDQALAARTRENELSSRPSEFSATLVDQMSSAKVAKRKPITGMQPINGINKAKTTRQMQTTLQQHDTSINETVVMSQKPPRKRKLVDELKKVEQIVRQKDIGTSQEVLLWCGEGQSRPGSDVTSYDVILQTVMDIEKLLSEEAEDDPVSHRLIQKVMGKLKRSIKPKITKVKEMKDLQSEIRKRKNRCNKIMSGITEQQKMKAELRTAMDTQMGPGQDANMIRISEWMKGYSQLMDTFTTKQNKET